MVNPPLVSLGDLVLHRHVICSFPPMFLTDRFRPPHSYDPALGFRMKGPLIPDDVELEKGQLGLDDCDFHVI